jgi:multidrug efflux pump subunit AcrA (membrane-fusion protein)
MLFSAKIEKSGVISIYAQSQGIVQKVKVTEGQAVKRGTVLVALSTNYQGGNIASLSRQIAQKNYDFNVQNYDAQKDVIAKQKDLANKVNTQASELRSITRQSLDETRGLISLNQDIIGRIDEEIKSINDMCGCSGPENLEMISYLQAKAMAQSSLNQLQASLRSADYQSNDSSTGAQISNLTRDLAIKQLELQEKSLTLTKDVSELNVKLARVSESLMYPAAPFPGTVERVFVNPGESVSPGTLLATLKANKGENTAIVLVTREVSKQIARTEPSYLTAGDQQLKLYPRYISTEATEGNLYSVMYDIPAESASLLTNTELLKIQIPVGNKAISANHVVVPLDAIYQTQDKAYVSVIRKNEAGQTIAKTVEVTLGEVSGSFVQVTAGLNAEDQVITSRNVQDGDVVKLP